LSSHVGGTRAADNPEAAPLAIVVSGDLDPEVLFAGLERRFGSLVPGTSTGYEAEEAPDKQVFSWMAHPVAQAQLGYGVRAPALSTVDSAPWQALLYILSHGYEGRLGKEAISRRGLIYYIDSAYHSDAERGWISLAIGVDPLKLKVMDSLLQEQLQGLLINPPSEEEVREARQHFLGRYLTANQSNLERSTFLARQYIQHGRLLSDDEITRGIESITREQVLAIIPRFVNGTTVVVDYQEAPPANN
jgi:predicted Zn-dependent peptidase